MTKKKFMTLFVFLALVLLATVSIFFLSRHTYQMETNRAMEQQERINQLYREQNLNRPFPSDDPMDAPLVLIGFAGLRSLGFSQEEVEVIWVEGATHPDFVVIRGFLAGIIRQNYEYQLRLVFRDNFSSLAEKFPEITDKQMPLTMIPLSALKEIIRLWEAENRPQLRPVAEIESEP